MSHRPRDIGRKYYVAVKRGLKLKKAEAEKEKCIGLEFSRTTIENPKKALEESQHSENGSPTLQIAFNKTNAPAYMAWCNESECWRLFRPSGITTTTTKNTSLLEVLRNTSLLEVLRVVTHGSIVCYRADVFSGEVKLGY